MIHNKLFCSAFTIAFTVGRDVVASSRYILPGAFSQLLLTAPPSQSSQGLLLTTTVFSTFSPRNDLRWVDSIDS